MSLALAAMSAAPAPGPLPPEMRHLGEALEASRDVVALYDPDDWLCYANPAFRATFLRGHDGGPIHFADILRLGFRGGFGVKIDCNDIERFLADILPRRRAKPQRALESDTVDGRWLWITETLLPSGWLLCQGTDITRLKHDEKTLRQSQAELAERAGALARSNEDLEQFAYVASHDLQEPLRTVASYTQLLTRDQGGVAAEYAGFIREAVTRMRDLIDGLLVYSRADAQPAAEVVDLREVLDGALANLEGLIHERHAVVTAGPLPVLRADRHQLSQVLQNLVGNALKFCGERPQVRITAQAQGSGWVLSVQDNGIGIEPQHLPRLFAIFQRLHTRDAYPGTGIGLAVCKKIVARHGGRIWAESAGAGQGTTFRLWLPAP